MVIIMNSDMIFGDVLLPSTTKDERLLAYAESFRAASLELETVKEKLDYYKEQILSELPEDCGEYEIPFADHGRIKLSAPEKYVWDKELLGEMFVHRDLPECMTQNYTVEKRRFDAADETEKSFLRKALTIKRGTVTFKVLKT